MTDTPTPTITIGETEHSLAPLSADKALRLFDIAAAAADEIQGIWERTEKWRAEQAELDPFVITAATFDDKSAAAQLADAGITPARVEEAGGEIRLPSPPGEVETIAYALPSAYRTLRDPMLDALAIVIAPADELLDADDAGETAEYLAGWRRTIRSESTPDQLFESFVVAYEYVRAQLFSGDGAGKVKSLAMRAMGISAPEAPKPARKSSTRSPKRPAGRDASAS